MARSTSGRATARQLERLLECVPGGVFEYHEDAAGTGRLGYFSPAFAALFPVATALAARAGEASGAGDVAASSDAPSEPLLALLFHPGDAPSVARDLGASRARLSPWHGEYRRRRADGLVSWVEVRAVPRRDRGGCVRWTGFVADVTARVCAEIELRQAKAEAQRASRLKGEFVAAVSHELRTPMTTILGYGELLRDHPAVATAPDVAEAVDAVMRNGEHLLDVVGDILDDARMESGAMAIRQVPTDLSRVTEDAVALLQVRARAKGIGLSFHGPGHPLPEVPSDPLRVRQIILNLLGNALKFTDRGGVEVRVEPADERIRIRVRDSGIGMSADDLARLFKPFSQVQGVRASEGSGLGLSVARRMAVMLGGDITVESTPGRGTEFALDLPFRCVSASMRVSAEHDAALGAPASRAESPRPAAAAARGARLAGMRILLAEDGPDSARLFIHQLRGEGAEVHHAANGREALGLLQAAEFAVLPGPFHIVLMDVQMPVMDGPDAAAAIRASGNRVPMLAFTAGAGARERQRCESAGFDAVLAKPIARDALVESILRWAVRPGSPPDPVRDQATSPAPNVPPAR